MSPGPHQALQGGTVADADLDLVQKTLGGDSRAFEALVRRHESRVYRTTIAVTGDAADAEDAMQETFIKAFQHLGEFRRDARFTTWLTRIAVNESLQILRRRRPMASLDDPDLPLSAVRPRHIEKWGENPEKKYAAQQLRQIIEEAIQSLEPPYRVVFVLRELVELSTEETAAALQLSVAAVKSRTLRARLMVREALARRFQQAPTLRARASRAAAMLRHMLEMALPDRSGPEGEQQ
jgi:RNA polymerase sigma-70 factor (ECF subfamily)